MALDSFLGSPFGPGGAWELLGKNLLMMTNQGKAPAATLGAKPFVNPMAAMNKPKREPAGFAIGTKILRGS